MAEKSNPSSHERDRHSAEPGASAEAPSSPTGTREERAAESSSSGTKRTGTAQDRPVREHVALKNASSLERLRDRVETAAHELKRLREENQALSERIKELEARPSVDPKGTFLSLDHDPELLQKKISGFIEAIDRYLEKERNRS